MRTKRALEELGAWLLLAAIVAGLAYVKYHHWK